MEEDSSALMCEEAEDVFSEGVSSRFPEIMSAGTHSPGGPNGIIRSQSFAGFSTLQERRSRCNSFIGNSVQKKPQAKLKKAHAAVHKSSSGSSSREPQPKRVEEVYNALKRGLDEYLEVHQVELDKLTSLMKDMKRNSRLGVLYDLDKQIKTIERYVRRLEFHISKVDELYEAFCIQRRLRDGASKMKQAFSASPSTKGTRESLAEVNRRYKEYSENMSTFEGELENLLGEFHIKMKGLAGFARLCPGDQYEIFMRYGRQRWKLKGKIEVNSRQSWDAEEMVFLPLINDLLSIKVSELKGLATHVLVGSVICETKDLFTAMPQVVAVDVNDLGTIKLNLEVTWFPFDVEDLTLSSGNLNKATALQRRVSVYSQGTPETPTFQDTSFFKWQPLPSERQRLSFLHVLRHTLLEKLRRSRSFGDLTSLRPLAKSSLEVYSALRDDVFENGSCGGSECKRLSFTFTDVPQSSTATGQSNPEITVTPPETEPRQRQSPEEGPETVGSGAAPEEAGPREEAAPTAEGRRPPGETEAPPEREWDEGGSGQASPRAVQPEDLFLDPGVSDALLRDEGSELKPVELDTDEGSLTKQLVKRLTSADATPEDGSPGWAPRGDRTLAESCLEEAIQTLLLRLEGLGEKDKELQELEQEVMRLEDLLKCRAPAQRSRSSSLSLTVESALESFDFLNTSDFEDDDTGDDGLPRSVFFDTEPERTGRSGQHPEARGHLSEALTEDTGVGNSVAGSPLPLTTGNESLDTAIVIHLHYCHQLVQLLSTGGSSLQRSSQLRKLSAQCRLLEELGEISTDRLSSISSVAEVISGLAEKPTLLSLWAECSGSVAPFHTTVDRVLKHMHRLFAATLEERQPCSADTVIRLAVSEMLDQVDLASCPCPVPPALSQDFITVFQFHSYACEHGVLDMGEHLLRLAREVTFAEVLRCGDPERVVRELQDVPASGLRPRAETLGALAALLIADGARVSEAAAAFLVSASGHPPFRSKQAVESYTRALCDTELRNLRATCAALSRLQTSESIEPLVSLCDSADEERRQVAMETLLALGEEGRLAYEQLDTVPREMVRLGTRRGNAVTTAF
ncbi:rho family-interacting cell polarization regulator 2 isoform X3 [Scleropages formosus]|uniref:rho family-interacting cell polarization regulator 2 isoform X3 n=1 Tax=Scleropages formosus TaxID=113540 RepID=UPI0010FA9E58|nr:rho family-interacting cell polarization regulator 2 isoform X3 [Scleropages formosus]